MNKNIKMMLEGAIMIALSAVLSSITIYRMPQGGSVTLASYVPLMIFALRWGVKPGLVVGFLYGILDGFIDPYIIYPVQYLLDYPIAYMTLGLAGFGRSEESLDVKIDLKLIGAAVFALFMRYLVACISGYVFFKSTLPADLPLFIGSMAYNATYVLPNSIFSLLVLLLVYKPVSKISK